METFNLFKVSTVYCINFAPALNEQQLFQSTLQLFMRYGVKSVSMDDIAKELGISKKTLYTYITDKEDLVYKTMELFMTEHHTSCMTCMNADLNPLERLLSLIKHMAVTLGDMNPSLTFDLQKYHGKTWGLLKKYRVNVLYELIRDNLIEGIATDWYRDDFNPNIVAHLYIQLVDNIFDVSIFPINEYQPSTLIREVILYHLNGVASSKGKKYLEDNQVAVNILNK
jgi:AcrR family transcriptional regulator